MSVCDAVLNVEKGKRTQTTIKKEQQVRLEGSYPAQVRRYKVTCR